MVAIPSFSEINNKPARQSSFAIGMHPNPYFYKYYWWVYWRGSPVDGPEFLTNPYLLCTADAMMLINRLGESGESHWVYNRQYPRLDAIHGFPFDLKSARWKNTKWALAFDKDIDPVWKGFK